MASPMTDRPRFRVYAQDVAPPNDLQATAAQLILHRGEKEWSAYYTSLRFAEFSRIFS